VNLARYYTAALIDKGLPLGTALENKVTYLLSRAGVLDRFQHRVGRYRLDYAWPDLLVNLEADGPHHMRPDMAARDAYRSAEFATPPSPHLQTRTSYS
jgi:hypothetical protein